MSIQDDHSRRAPDAASMPGAEPTGTVLLSLQRGAGEESYRRVAERLGIAAKQVASAEDFAASPIGAWDDALVYRAFDLMALRRPLAEVESRLAGLDVPITGIHQERWLRRPETPIHDHGPVFTPEEFRRIYGFLPPEEAPAFLEEKLAWGLQAIGCAELDPAVDGTGVKIAVLDSGIVGHPDLPVPADARSFVPGEASTVDSLGHGTHCAGLLCARQPAARPRFGVAPGATLYVARVANAAGGVSETWVINAIWWALALGCQVISLSVGRAANAGPAIDSRYESIAATANNQGALIVAAAGNESERIGNVFAGVDQPAASDNVMAIGGITSSFSVYDTSNRGAAAGPAAIDLASPGADIMSAWKDGDYRWLSGTSAATPLVAGVAALWRQKNPGLGPAAIWQLMVQHAKPLLDAAGNPLDPRDVGAGLVQVPRASGT